MKTKLRKQQQIVKQAELSSDISLFCAEALRLQHMTKEHKDQRNFEIFVVGLALFSVITLLQFA